MFTCENDKGGGVRRLFAEFTKYLELQTEYTKLEIVEKLTVLFSAFILVLILIVLGMVAVFYLSFALAYVLESVVGGLAISFIIVVGMDLVLIILIVLLRKYVIINPITRFLARLFLN